MRAQIEDQRIKHSRRELELHEFGASFLRSLKVFGSRAPCLLMALNACACKRAIEAKRRAASSGSGPVSTASSLSSSSSVSSSRSDSLPLRRFQAWSVLRLSDDVRRIGIDETDDEVDQARLATLTGS